MTSGLHTCVHIHTGTCAHKCINQVAGQVWSCTPLITGLWGWRLGSWRVWIQPGLPLQEINERVWSGFSTGDWAQGLTDDKQVFCYCALNLNPKLINWPKYHMQSDELLRLELMSRTSRVAQWVEVLASKSVHLSCTPRTHMERTDSPRVYPDLHTCTIIPQYNNNLHVINTLSTTVIRTVCILIYCPAYFFPFPALVFWRESRALAVRESTAICLPLSQECWD